MKNIGISEKQEIKKFGGTRYLRTNLVGGGTCDWVDEDDVETKTLYVSKKGTYIARNDGVYGYDEVVVSGQDKVIGKDGNGNDIEIITDEDGNLRETDLPSEIRIKGLPARTVYKEGEAINLVGINVKAYRANGTLWTSNNYPLQPYYERGEVPAIELVPEPKIATGGSGIVMWTTPLDDRSEFYRATGGQFSFSKMNSSTIIHGNTSRRYWTLYEGENVFMMRHYSPIQLGNYYDYIHLCSPNEFAVEYHGEYGTEIHHLAKEHITGYAYKRIQSIVNSNSFLPAETYMEEEQGGYSRFIRCSDMITFGMGLPPDSDETITVKWARPEDGKILEATFDIAVSADTQSPKNLDYEVGSSDRKIPERVWQAGSGLI